jgi:hypothetical protein
MIKALWLFLSLFLAAAPTALAAPTVYLQPSAASVASGADFTVEVRVEDVADLFAFNLSVSWDRASVRFVASQEGSFLSSAAGTFFFEGVPDEAAGRLDYVANTVLGDVPGVSGGGVIALLHFTADAPGMSGIDLEDVLMLDSQLGDIAVHARGTSISVVRGGSVPEPATAGLAFLAIAAAWVGRRSSSPRGACRQAA